MSQTTDHEQMMRVGSMSDNTDGGTNTIATTTKQSSEPEIVFDRKKSSEKVSQMQLTVNDANADAGSNDGDKKQELEVMSHKSHEKNISRGDSVARKLTFSKSTIDALQGAQDEIKPEHILCCEVKQDRKSLVIGLQFLVVFGIVLSYFIYKMVQLFDTDADGANRNEYIINESVDEMPIPYVYIDSSSNNSCLLYIESENNTWISGYNSSDSLDSSSTMENILDTTESNGIIISNYYGGFNQFWFIPPSDLYISVGEKSQLKVYFLCFEAENSTDIAYFQFGHKDELNQYNSGFDFFKNAYSDSSYFYPYYERRLSYVWHTNKNKIDKKKSLSDDEKYDYLIFSGEATYHLEDIFGDYYVYYPAYFVLQPNGAGTKTFHITEEYFDFLDVLSSTGGIFASVNSFCALIALYFIWGFELRCFKFRGKLFCFCFCFCFCFFSFRCCVHMYPV